MLSKFTLKTNKFQPTTLAFSSALDRSIRTIFKSLQKCFFFFNSKQTIQRSRSYRYSSKNLQPRLICSQRTNRSTFCAITSAVRDRCFDDLLPPPNDRPHTIQIGFRQLLLILALARKGLSLAGVS